MLHTEWKTYDSGEIEPGDIVQLDFKAGDVMHQKCPVCTKFLKRGVKECPSCKTKYDKVSSGYIIHSVRKRV